MQAGVREDEATAMFGKCPPSLMALWQFLRQSPCSLCRFSLVTSEVVLAVPHVLHANRRIRDLLSRGGEIVCLLLLYEVVIPIHAVIRVAVDYKCNTTLHNLAAGKP